MSTARIIIIVLSLFYAVMLAGNSDYLIKTIQFALVVISGIELKILLNIQFWLLNDSWVVIPTFFLSIAVFSAYYDLTLEPQNEYVIIVTKILWTWYVMFILGSIAYTITVVI